MHIYLVLDENEQEIGVEEDKRASWIRSRDVKAQMATRIINLRWLADRRSASAAVEYLALQVKEFPARTSWQVPIEISDEPQPEQEISSKEIAEDFATQMVKKHDFVCTRKGDELWVYGEDNDLWELQGDITIRREADEQLDEEATTHLKNEVIRHVKDRSQLIDYDDFNTNPWLIGVKNGVLDLSGNEAQLLEATPNQMLTWRIPVTYRPNAKCPAWDTFLPQVCPSEEAQVREMFGYCLYSSYPYHRFFVLIGPGANGKTTILIAFSQFLGAINVSSQTMQNLTKNRFRMAELHGKLANISSETPDPTSLTMTANIKALTGGDRVSAERKNGHPFDFTNTAKLIFAANELPPVTDKTYAFWRRPVLISFPNSFKKGDPKTRKQNEIVAELTTDDEMSGLLNKCIKALQDLNKRKDFEETKTQEEIKAEWLRLSDSVASFIHECCTTEPKIDKNKLATGTTGPPEVEKNELYAAYVEYCNEILGTGTQGITSNIFTRRLKSIVPVMEQKKGTQKRYKVWSGIRLKSTVELEEEGEKDS